MNKRIVFACLLVFWVAVSSSESYGQNPVTDQGWKIAAAGDFNLDGQPDIVWRHSVSGRNVIWLMNGSVLLSEIEINTVSNTAWKIVASGDFNLDGRPDIVWRNSTDGRNIIWVMDRTAFVSAVEIIPVASAAWKIVGTGDFNLDGKPDILWRNSSDGRITIWLMYGTLVASQIDLNSVANTAWTIVAVGDFNVDGKPDILWRNSTDGRNTIWLMNGTAFASAVGINGVVDPAWKIVSAGDFNRDGRIDILWRNTADGRNTIWLMNGTAFASAAAIDAWGILSGGMISKAYWSLKSVDSQELAGGDQKAVNAFDARNTTLWESMWYSLTDPLPHEIQINLGGVYSLTGFKYLPRQDGVTDGGIRQYQFFVSANGTSWGSAAASGTFSNSATEKQVNFSARTGQFVRLRAIGEVGDKQVTSAAEINVRGACVEPSVRLVKPLDYHLQTSSNLQVAANVCLDPNLHMGWGVRFILDGGPQNGGALIDDFTAPYGATFTNLAKKEHTVDAVLLDHQMIVVPGEDTQDQSIRVGIGDFYVAMGDSITNGGSDDGDNLPADDVSQDGRNAGGGYAPVLNNSLTSARGYPQTILNHGVGGVTSAYGVQLLPTLLGMYPDAQLYLILYGMNDARPWEPVPSGLGLNPGDPGYSGSFKDNIQQMINLINAAGKQAALGKVPIALGDCNDPGSCPPYPDPYTGARTINILEYNQVVDDLIGNPANRITVTPPDFFNYFAQHYMDEYIDNIHPNGIGYQSMARLWCGALTGGACN